MGIEGGGGGGGGGKERTMNESSTSPSGHFREFLMSVHVNVSGPADVY